ncbi:MAG: hypothetical protein J5988_08865 [Eubacterium sp.]|nr:hypothetical protein [Eubacterium sp.]
MRFFLTLYGKTIVAVLGVVTSFILTGYSLKEEWNRHGIAPNGRQKIMVANTVVWGPPVLDSADKRFPIGKTIMISSLAKARDSDGKDLTNQICYTDDKGDVLPKQWVADKPGVYHIRISVKSPVTQKENRKRIIVIIDGSEEV